MWNPKTGRPWYNAIVWQDTRTERYVNALEPYKAAAVRAHRTAPSKDPALAPSCHE